MLKKLFCIIAVIAASCGAFAHSEANPQPATPKSDISYFDAAVLGLVEGITEYLPVSSTGHLIISNRLLGLDSDTPLKNADGETIYLKKASNGAEAVPYTMKHAADAYAVIIQIGAIFAVALLYRGSILRMALGLLGKDRSGLMLLRNLLAAFIPAALVGFLLHDAIEEFLFGVYPVIFALAAGGILMLYIQKRYDAAHASNSVRSPEIFELTLHQSLIVGVLQCVALWPGTSRSMMTILGGYVVGLKPARAAEFSFLLGLVTLSAASLFKMLKDGQCIAAALSVGPLALGLAVAFVSAALSVKWLVGFLTRRGLAPFAYYRFAIAALLMILFACN